MMFKAFLFVLLVLAPGSVLAEEAAASGAAVQPAVVAPAAPVVEAAPAPAAPEAAAPAPEAAVAPVPEAASPAATPDVVEPVKAGDVEAPAIPATEKKDVVGTPDVKEAIPIPQTDAQAADQTNQAVSAFGTGSYALGALLLIGVIVFVIRRFSKKTDAPK